VFRLVIAISFGECKTKMKRILIIIFVFIFVVQFNAFAPTANAAAAQISGRVYTDEGTTGIGAGKTLRLLVNGLSAGTATTDANGAYSISLDTLNSGSTLLIYIDNDATYKGTTVSVSDGASLSGFDIYASHVITRQDNGGTLSNANMSSAKGSSTDSDILYFVSSGTLTISGASTELLVAAGHKFAPGGNLSAANLKVNGTMTGGNNTFSIYDNWDSSAGQFSAELSTVNITGSGTLKTGPGYADFYKLKAAASGQTTTLANDDLWLSYLTVGSGTFSDGIASYSVFLTGLGDVLTDSGATFNLGTLAYRPANSTQNVIGRDYTGIANLNFYGNGGTGGINTLDVQGNITANNIKIYTNNYIGNNRLTVVNTNNHEIVASALEIGASGASTFYGQLNAGSSNITITSDVNINVSDTPGYNNINGGSATFNVGGNWTNFDTFIPGTSTVNFNGTNQSINNSTTFYNLTKTTQTANTLTFGANTTTSVNGKATLQGAAGQLLKLRSSASGTKWNLALNTGVSKDISYVDVQDSSAGASDTALKPINPLSSIDSGNNVDWFGESGGGGGNNTEVAASALAQIQWGVSSSYLDYLADNFNFIYQQPFDYEFSQSQLDYLHQKNPVVKIIRYRSSVEAFDVVSAGFADPYSWSEPFAERQNTETEWNDIWTNHQDWFLKNSGGNYIHRKSNSEMDGKRAFVMDPGNPGWRDWLSGKDKQFTDYGFDGIFQDLVTPIYWISGWDSYPVNPRTGQQYTNAQWRHDLIGLMSTVKQKLGNKLLIFNGLNTGNEYYGNNDPDPLDSSSADGLMIEGFIRWVSDPLSSYRSETNWKKDVDLLAKVSAANKIIMVNTGVSGSPPYEQTERIARYFVSSYLLGLNGSSVFPHFIAGNYPPDTGLPDYYEKDIPLYHLQVGDAEAPYYYENNLYQRNFTNGKVLVNPTDTGQSYSVDLGAYYKDPDGNIVRTITLASKTGTILVKNSDATPPVLLVNTPSSTSGVIELSAAVTGSSQIAEVEFYIDSNLVGSDTAGPSPYGIIWDSTTVSNGTYTLKVKAYDDSGNTSESSISIVIYNNHAPVLSPVGNKAVLSGTLLRFFLKASDPDGDKITYSAPTLPKGATLNSSTGEFRWVPTRSQAGIYYVTFKATDGNLSDSEKISIRVRRFR